VETWEEQCVAVHSKFGKDKHHRHLAALEHCKQRGTVEQYYIKFEELRHKVLVHNKHYDEAFFVTKFVNGLRRDIQRAIRLHGPRTVDAALALAETPEELLDDLRPHFSSRYKHDQKHYSRSGFPGKGLLGASPDEPKKNDEGQIQKPPWEDKQQSLKSQRRARGECFTCGNKFQPGHHCNKSMTIHMVEELLKLLQLSESDSETKQDSSSDE
jgi:hypothetical protein